MNELVKNSIECRKTAIFSAYNIEDQSLIEEIDSLFNRINEFGKNCTDSMDFESKFANSKLNQEYIELFTKIATTCPQIVRQSEPNRNIKSDAEYMADDIASEIRYQTRNATEPMRRQIHEETLKAARNTPVIGDILTVKQHVDFFSRFKKKKDKNENEKEENNKDDKQ